MDEQQTAEELKANVSNTNVWIRLVFMALFAVLYWAAEVVLAIVVAFQFLSVLLTGHSNAKVLSFGAQLSTYAYQIFRYLTFNSEEKPFPLNDWPTDAALQATEATTSSSQEEETKTAKEAAKPKKAPRKKAVKKEPAKAKEAKDEASSENKENQSEEKSGN